MTHPQPAKTPHRPSLRTWADRPLTDCSFFTSVMHYLLRVLLITISEFNKNDISLRSSALTYTILLSLVPMLALSTAVVKELGGGDQLRKAAYMYLATLEKSQSFKTTDRIDHIAPWATTTQEETKEETNLTGHLRSAVDTLFNYVDKTNFATLGTIGVIGVLIGVLLMLSHIESAMNVIWKVSAARQIPRKIADYLTLMILLPISVNVAFAAGAFLKSPALALRMDRLIPFEWLQSLLLKPIPIFFISLTFYAMYIFFPNTRVKNLPAVVAALLAALVWFMVQNVYIGLQLGVSNYNAIYGSFATLPLFILWMYLGWVFILTGAQLAYAFQNVTTYRLVPFSGSPSLKLGAAFDIMDHIYTSLACQKPVTAQTLAGSLPHYYPQIITEALDKLITAGVVHVSQTDSRLLPALPPEQYERQKVVNIILGTEAPDTAGGILSRRAIAAAGTQSDQDILPATGVKNNHSD